MVEAVVASAGRMESGREEAPKSGTSEGIKFALAIASVLGLMILAYLAMGMEPRGPPTSTPMPPATGHGGGEHHTPAPPPPRRRKEWRLAAVGTQGTAALGPGTKGPSLGEVFSPSPLASIGGLSSRGMRGHLPLTAYADMAWAAMMAGLWNASFPEGYFLLLSAENKQVGPMLRERFSRTSTLSVFEEPRTLGWYDAYGYCDPRGTFVLRAAVARILSTRFSDSRVSVDPDEIVVGLGATGILNVLSTFLAEAGSPVLVPAPYYTAFDADTSSFAGLRPIPVYPSGEGLGPLAVSDLDRFLAANPSCRIFILTNPHNPLGTTLSRKRLQEYVDWSRRNKVHLIVDEIYALSVWDGSFTSVIDLLNGDLGDYVHVAWALSKDFGSSGFRMGFLYTRNVALKTAFASLNVYNAPPEPLQRIVAGVLMDDEWVASYLEHGRSVLKNAYDKVAVGLKELDLPVHEASGGIFVWTDMAELLPEWSWDGEDALVNLFFEEGMAVTPGRAQHSATPGCIRIITAWHTPEGMDVVMERIAKMVASIRLRGWVEVES